jgi:mono/diheme cytochrome c family protein
MAQARSDDKPALSVCVIAYNSGPTLRTCLEHLGAQSFLDFEAIVIDNASPDPGDAAIAAEFPWVRLIRNSENLGFTGDYRVRGAGATMTRFPFPVTKVVLERGKERYEIYCAPCHGKTGAGDGMIVRRGFSQPPTYHQARLREAPVGHFFDVMTNGFGAMYPYADKVSPEDRWAITAYIRALQLSQNASAADVAAGKKVNPGGAKAPRSTPGDTTFDSSPTRPDTEHLQDPATAN